MKVVSYQFKNKKLTPEDTEIFIVCAYGVSDGQRFPLCASAVKKLLKLKTAYLKLPTKFLDVLQYYEMP